MSTNYSGRYSKPLGCSLNAMGGAAQDMGIEALTGEGDWITVFDDFNGHVPAEGFDGVTNWETMGWILTEDQAVVGAVNGDVIGMNAAATNTADFDSCISITTSTDEDNGGNMQLDPVNATLPASANNGGGFPHIWIPDSATVGGYGSSPALTALDHTQWMFACRIGFKADITTTGDGNWNGKVFIGWAEAGDASILTSTDGLITQAETGPLVGFHVCELGEIYGVAQRTASVAYAEGTNRVTLYPAGGVDGTLANGATTVGDTMWFDLALRMDIVDASEAADNGRIRFYHRRVLPNRPLGSWIPHITALDNVTPNNNERLVPTIESLNGPTAGQDTMVFVDWWAFGRNRPNRTI